MKLNEELDLVIPEGFHALSEAELSNMQMIERGEGAAFSDPERHMLVSIGWKKAGMLTSLFLNLTDLGNLTAKNIASAMSSFRYQEEERRTDSLDGCAAEGVRYTYLAQGVEMTGESFALRHGKTLYYLHCYSRTALWTENRKVWEEIIRSGRWA